MSGTDLPTQKISDEMVMAFIADQAPRYGYSSAPDGAFMRMYREPTQFERIRAGLAAALVASGYRREADVRAAIAFEIRAELVCCDIYERLSTERDERRWRTEQTKGHDLCYWGEGAARIAESHEPRTLNGATALKQAQPLLAAGSEVESLEPVESSEGQERSEEPEHG